MKNIYIGQSQEQQLIPTASTRLTGTKPRSCSIKRPNFSITQNSFHKETIRNQIEPDLPPPYKMDVFESAFKYVGQDQLYESKVSTTDRREQQSKGRSGSSNHLNNNFYSGAYKSDT